MKTHFKSLFVLLFGLAFVINACQKEKDPPPTDGDDRLTNPYCNDPNTVNYNWGFPGIPDNSVCFYPVDTFIGNWLFLDSIFDADSSFFHYETKSLTFSSSEDTINKHLSIQGWCGADILFAVADKYKRATVDTLDENINGQIICNPSDTITGVFNLNTYKQDSMMIDLKVKSQTGVFYHKGWAIKQ